MDDGGRDLVVPVAELRGRLERTRFEMASRGLDALLVYQPDNIYYLTGFAGAVWSYQVLLVPHDSDPRLLARYAEEGAVRQTSWLSDADYWHDLDEESPVERTARMLRERGLSSGRLGIELGSWFLLVRDFLALRELLPQARFEDSSGLVNRLRLVKSAREVELIAIAARAVSAAARAALPAVREGISEAELGRIANDALMAAGADGPMLEGIHGGARTARIHGLWTFDPLARGDEARLELTASHEHYVARVMRTAIVGEASREQRRTAEALARAQDEGLARLAPGVEAREVDGATKAALRRAGHESVLARTGYSVGILIRPSDGEFELGIRPDSAWRFAPGMCFHMLLFAGRLGISETVAITERGARVLTDVERRLF
jgi:Xaa-Pro dipeptidase